MIALSGTKTEPAAALQPQSPSGASYINDAGVHAFEVSAQHSGSITVASNSTNPVEVSFDSGTTWPLQLESGEIQSWGSDPVNGVVLGQIRARGLRTNPIVGVTATWSMTGT